MAGPWERYKPVPTAGPWDRYKVPQAIAPVADPALLVKAASAPARIATTVETGLPDFYEAPTQSGTNGPVSPAVPRAPFDLVTGRYDPMFVHDGEPFDLTQPDARPANVFYPKTVFEQAISYPAFAIRGVAEGAVINPIDAVSELINHTPVLLDKITHAPRDLAAYLAGVDLPETPFPARSITSTLSGLLGVQDPGASPASGLLRLYEDATGGRVLPGDGIGRVIERVGQEIGGTLLPIGWAGRTANALELAGKTGVAAARDMSPLAKMFVEPMLADSRQAIRRELSAATAAGLGAGMAREVAGDSPTVDVAGALGGATLGSLGTGIVARIRDIVSALGGNPAYASRLVRENVTDALLRNSDMATRELDPADPFRPIDTTEMVRAISRPSRAETTIPGYVGSTADRAAIFDPVTGERVASDTGLADLEQARRTGGQNKLLFDQRRKANVSAVDAAVQAVAPQETPGTFRSALGAARDTQLRAAETAALRDRQAADDIIAALTPAGQQADRGGMLRSQIEAGHEAAQARTRAAYDQVGQDVQVDPVDLSGVIDNAVAGLTETERSLLPEGLLARVQRLGRPVDPVIPQALRDDIEQTTDEIASEISRYTKRDVKPFDIDAWLAETDPQGGLIFEGGSKQGRRDIAEESLSAEWRMAFEHSKKDGNLKFLYDRLATLRGEEQRAMGSTSAPPISLEEAKTLRSELGRRISAALADPKAENGGRVAARALGRVSSALDNFITSNLDEEQRALEMTARSTKQAEAEAFGRPGDPVAEAIAQRPGGVYKQTDANVARIFGDDARKIDTLLSRVDTPETRTALREELLSRMRTATARDVDGFLRAYGDRLDRFPGLRGEVEAAAGARRASEASAEASVDLRRVVGPGGRGDVAKYLEFGDAQGQRAMKGVLASKDPARTADELLNYVGNAPGAVEGARRAFWDVMEERARSTGMTEVGAKGEQAWLPTKWRSFLNDANVRSVAGRLYRDDPEQWARVNEIADVLREASTGKAGAVANNPSGTATASRGQKVTLAEMQAKGYEVARRRVNLLYFMTFMASRFANRAVASQSEAAFAKLLDKALLDPEVATELLKQNNPANRAVLTRRAKGWLGAEYVNGVNALLGPERGEDDEMLDAIGAGP